MTRRSRLLVLAVVAAGALVSGCAVPDPGAGQAAATDPPSADAQYRVPEGGQRTGAVATSITSDQTFTLQGAVGDDGGVDFAAYDESMDFALGAISEYWIETMARITKITPPSVRQFASMTRRSFCFTPLRSMT